MGLGISAFFTTLLLLTLLVVVHELGHLIMARFFGVKVHEFSVGFGPLIGKFNRHGIQYSFRWFLVGGFVKIAGMEMSLEGEPGAEQVAPHESFQFISAWKKVLVIAAGPIANLILGMILVFCLFAVLGTPAGYQGDSTTVMMANPGTPAFKAGIQPGDKLLVVNGQPVSKWQDIIKAMQSSRGEEITVVFERAGQKLSRQIIPNYDPTQRRYLIGIGASGMIYKRSSLGRSAREALVYPWFFAKQLSIVLGRAIAHKKLKDLFMGPVALVAVNEQMLHLPVSDYLFQMLSLAINISLFLFLFNMLPLPLPLLDGGWIVILLLEKLRGREFSVQQKAVAQTIGLSAIILLGLWIIYGDLLMTLSRFWGR